MSTQTTEETMAADLPTEIAIDEAGDVTLPVQQLLTGRGFITGKSGSGKSNSASVIAEELLDAGLALAIIDTDGEYYGLKEEYEVLHVGAGEACDLRVKPEHAERLARLALEEGVPLIIDVADYVDDDGVGASSAHGRELVHAFAQALFRLESEIRQPFPLLVEEIHEYVPEGPALDDLGQLLVQIGKRGRKRGLGLTGLSQRPADVKKDFITQCDWLIWHRLTWSNDTKQAKRVLGADYEDLIEGLGDGEGFLQADWDDEIRRVQFRRKRTFDAGATPGLGEVERPELKSVSEDLVAELESISEEEAQRQDEIERLESRLESKDDRIAKLERDLEQARDVGNAAQQLAEAFKAGGGGDAIPEDIETQLAEKNDRIADLEDERDALADDVERLEERVGELQSAADRADRLEARIEAAEDVERRLEYVRSVLGGDIDVGEKLEIVRDDDAGESELASQHVAELSERIDELEAENERLRAAGGDDGVGALDSYQAFLEDDDVRAVIEEAKAEDYPSPKYTKGILAAILETGGPVAYADIADRLGVSRTNEVSSAATTLETYNVVEKEKQNDGVVVDLNVDGLQEIREAAARRRRTSELMDEL